MSLKLVKEYFSTPLTALTLVIIFWSATPIALLKSFLLLPQEIMASVAVLLAAILLSILYLLFNPTTLQETIELIKGDFTSKDGHLKRAYFYLIILSTLGFFLYPWLLIQALQESAKVMEGESSVKTAAPVIVNMVNYLWPCFAVLFGWLFVREKLTSRRIGGLFLSLLGAFLAVSSTTGIQEYILKNLYPSIDANISISSIREIWFIVFACLGAISWGIYTALLPKCNFINKSGNAIKPASFYIALLILSLPLHFFYAISQWKIIITFNYQINFSNLAAFFIYCIGSLCIAHPLFTYVRRSNKISLSAIAASTYFVFALGTFLLYFFTNPTITLPISAGFALILTGAYIAQDRYLFSPVSGFIIFFIISYGLSSFFSPTIYYKDIPNNDSIYMSFLETLTAVFSIISGFILSRAISHHFEQQRKFQEILQDIGRLCRCQIVEQHAKKELTEIVGIINLLFSYFNNMGRFYEKHEEILQKFEKALIEFENKLESSVSSRTEISEEISLIKEIRDGTIFWIASRFQKGSHYELLALVCLVVIMCLIGYRIELNEPIYRIARAAFDASIIVIILAIGDFDAGRPGNALKFLRFSHRFLPVRYRIIENDLIIRLENNIKLEFLIVVSIAVMGIISIFQF